MCGRHSQNAGVSPQRELRAEDGRSETMPDETES